jgi:Protein of unknown function (DUF2510)
LEDATSRVSEALRPTRSPEPDRSVMRRILLAYPFQRWTAQLLRVAYYLLLAFTAMAPLSAASVAGVPGITPGGVVSIVLSGLIVWGLLAFAVRAWAVSIENRNAKRRTSKQPVASTGVLTAPQPGWYPDPSGASGQRYWDGQQWTHVAPRST